MVTTRIGKHTVEMYGAVDELPVVRFHKYQKLLLIDAGIGGDVSALDQPFAALVKRVDKEEIPDASDASIDRVLELLADVPSGEIDGQLMSVKKKIEGELTLYFPTLFESPETKEYFDLMKRRTAAVLSLLAAGINPNGNGDVEELTTRMATLAPARVFDGPEGEEVKADRNFEDVCLVLSEQLHINPKTCTVFEYYSAYDFVQRRQKEAEKAQNKPKFRR